MNDLTCESGGPKCTTQYLVQGNLDAALEGLLNIEKQQRLAEEITTCKMACTAIVQLLYEAKQWNLLNENILLLAKRRSQLKQAILPTFKPTLSCTCHTFKLAHFHLFCPNTCSSCCQMQTFDGHKRSSLVRSKMGLLDQRIDRNAKLHTLLEAQPDNANDRLVSPEG